MKRIAAIALIVLALCLLGYGAVRNVSAGTASKKIVYSSEVLSEDCFLCGNGMSEDSIPFYWGQENIALHCILPCKEQAEKWSASSQNLYYSILDRADSIVYVSRAYHKNCMLERNRFLVDHAAALLAVYNGERRGGTAATMRYAQKMGREIITIDPATRLISHSNPVPEPTHS